MKSIKLVCLFLALIFLGIGCKKKTTATKTRKELIETKMLLQASWVCDFERIQSLISKGVDVNVKDGDGGTPLHYAAKHGHKNVVELLVAGGADVNAKTIQGQTPLQLAQDKL